MPARLPATAAAAGLATLVVGLFLPWFRSGAVLRDSFESVGVIRTLGFLRGTGWAWLPAAWFSLVPVVTLCVAAYALGLRRTSATLCLVVTILSGTVAGGAAVGQGSGDSSLGIAGTGPTTTAVGAVIAVVGAVGVLVGERRSARREAGGEQ
ncbi:hypothetical protein L6E12_30120 [Actinokineospora sp. PR83]|uniref:hypothetical protein n=1 Tax=Actinokineospora sp. PR83 TaxID=2884908 RepID=UPI001F3CFB06|nr:hypothetical protein [Actinokineospora sp. PR83]MCG8920036.1 hypothetical protein [Actinokineospora sp. PR83]